MSNGSPFANWWGGSVCGRPRWSRKNFASSRYFAIAGHAIQLHERELDLLVPGRVVPAVRAEHLADQIGAFDRDVQQRALAGRLEVRDGGLVEMALVVELVARRQPRPALGARARRRMRRVRGARGVEVAVRFLRLRDDGDELVDLPVEHRIGMRGERVGRGFDHLVDVGVVVSMPFVLARNRVRRLEEIVHTAGRLVLPHDVRDRDRPVDLDLRRPEPIGDPRHRSAARP